MNISSRKPIQISNCDNVFIIPALMEYTKNYIYYIHDKNDPNLAFIIDPGEAGPVIHFLEDLHPELPKPSIILNTHHHWDHVNGNLELKKKYNCKIIAAKSDFHRIPGVDEVLEYNQILEIGSYKFKIIHTPGHTRNHIAFYCETNKVLFCGDTMFSGGCGGIFEGTVEEMFISFEKFSKLPDDCIVFTAHEYTVGNLKFALYLEPENRCIESYLIKIMEKIKNGCPSVPSTIGIEKKINPFIKFNDPILKKCILDNDDLIKSSSDLFVFKKIMKQKENYYS
jgi:hydroxyacylglutathione hydrolase